jgi:hypothetical protein
MQGLVGWQRFLVETRFLNQLDVMARDVFHQQAKNALIKDGWEITHDLLTIRISEAVKLQIDVAAENAIANRRRLSNG